MKFNFYPNNEIYPPYSKEDDKNNALRVFDMCAFLCIQIMLSIADIHVEPDLHM